MEKKKKKCLWVRKFDFHFTPECVNDHGYRVNGLVKAETFKVCPYYVRPIKIFDRLKDKSS